MKQTILCALCVAASLSAVSQDITDDIRNFKLSVRNQKGRVPRELEIITFLSGDNEAGRIDQFGNRFFRISDGDTLNVVVGSTLYEFPLEGIDSLHLSFRNSGKLVDVKGPGAQLNLGYNTISLKDKTHAVGYMDMKGIEAYSDLRGYIQGKVPGVRFQNGRLVIRGTTSINSGVDPLIVVDGVSYDSFEAANRTVNPRDIESISVLKDSAASIYGMRGANGVVLITTKKAGK